MKQKRKLANRMPYWGNWREDAALHFKVSDVTIWRWYKKGSIDLMKWLVEEFEKKQDHALKIRDTFIQLREPQPESILKD